MFEFPETVRAITLWADIQQEIETKNLRKSNKLFETEVVATSPVLITKGKIQFDVNRSLGEGGCGTVFRGTFNDTPVAVKRVEKPLSYRWSG